MPKQLHISSHWQVSNSDIQMKTNKTDHTLWSPSYIIMIQFINFKVLVLERFFLFWTYLTLQTPWPDWHTPRYARQGLPCWIMLTQPWIEHFPEKVMIQRMESIYTKPHSPIHIISLLHFQVTKVPILRLLLKVKK